MRFVCDSCRAQYMISDEKVGPKGVKVRCKKCGYVILVKKTDGQARAAAPQAPIGGDLDDGLATQVMPNPFDQLGNPGATQVDMDSSYASEGKAPTGVANPLLSGVGEDEIGAVFDQVLSSSPQSLPKEGGQSSDALGDSPPANSSDDDDRMSTRVVDADTMRKLAEEAGQAVGEGAVKNGEEKKDEPEVPLTDWFVAIDEKQTGPLTLDKVKEHWERGEIGPDSLCWRAGFSDWVPVSEVAQLASLLAPRPAKPAVIVSSSAPMSSPPVVSVPVESAFSAGGVTKTVRSEMQVPLGTPGGPEESGSWRPSAASALASLVKEEMEALHKPPTKRKSTEPLGVGPETPSQAHGLLDLPAPSTDERAAINGHKNGTSAEHVVPEVRSRPAPANPYANSTGSTYSAPAVTQYRPPSNRNVTMALIIAGAAVAIVALLVFAVFLAVRPPVVVSPNPIVPPPPVVAAAPTAAPPAVAPPPAAAPPAVAAPQPGAAPTPGAVAPAPGAAPGAAPAAAPTAPTPRMRSSGSSSSGNLTTPPRSMAAVQPKETSSPPERSKPSVPEPKGDDDEFNSVFGKSDSSKSAKKEEKKEEPKKKSDGIYIPPAPGQGGGDVKERLERSDVIQVVLDNKPALQKCTEEQRRREPGLKGKLVMRWNIQTSGKATNVAVSSEEFKSTYLATCIGGVIKGMTFPKHKIAGEPIEFPFGF